MLFAPKEKGATRIMVGLALVIIVALIIAILAWLFDPSLREGINSSLAGI